MIIIVKMVLEIDRNGAHIGYTTAPSTVNFVTNGRESTKFIYSLILDQ